jgi:hypothetical protein
MGYRNRRICRARLLSNNGLPYAVHHRDQRGTVPIRFEQSAAVQSGNPGRRATAGAAEDQRRKATFPSCQLLGDAQLAITVVCGGVKPNAILTSGSTKILVCCPHALLGAAGEQEDFRWLFACHQQCVGTCDQHRCAKDCVSLCRAVRPRAPALTISRRRAST